MEQVHEKRAVNQPAVTMSAVPALYVGDMSTRITDASLFELFSTIGPVTSVRVCRNTVTGGSLGYGYVNYVSAQDATIAIEKLNHTVFSGKPIRIMWSQRDPDKRNSGVGNVFVKNLNTSIDTEKLEEMFLKFGTILSCKVVTQDGKSKGFGFVQFESQDSAKAAIENLHGTIIDGKQIYVGMFIKKSDRLQPAPELKYTNLYLKNLDQDITEELIKLKFSEYGKVLNVLIAKDEEGSSKGFGFVNFENPESAKKAVDAMNGLQLGSKKLYVSRAQKKAERREILRRIYEERRNEQIRKNMASNVYVKNIDDSVDDKILWEHFSQCGSIKSAKIMRSDKGISKGFGFVCYSNQEEASKAVNTFHGFMFHGKPLYVAIAQRKGERLAQLQLHYSQRLTGITGPAAAVIPTNYPPIYYGPSTVMPHIPSRHGLVYQPFGLRSGWQQNGYVPSSRPMLQHSPLPVFPYNSRHQKPNRSRMLPHSQQPFSSIPHLQQSNSSFNSIKTPNGRFVQQSGSSSTMISNLLATSSQPQQKQMIGDHLLPLVHQLKGDLAGKITGMLLEMDNSELLLLIESPEALAAKVEEAVQVISLSGSAAVEDAHHPDNPLSAEVAVN